MVMKDLFKRDILNCRKVCREWDDCVTQTYENHPDRLSENGGVPHAALVSVNGMPFERNISYDRGMSFRGTEDIARFLNEADSHPRNPIVGRSIDLETETSEEYRNGWARLLQKFGNEIHHARLTFNEGANPGRQTDPLESRLRDCLQLLPNLKSMNLEIGGYDNIYDPDLALRVRGFLAQTPFPQLPNLESFSYDAHVFPFLVRSLIRDSFTEKLKYLRTPFMDYDPMFRFPNLEELRINMQTDELLFLSEDYPRLKTLEVEFPGNSNLRFERAFQALEQFKETLTEVTIHSTLDFRFIKSDYRVNLPNLKILQINYGPFPGFPYEQLPALSSLPRIILENRAWEIEEYS